jgi:hypothetical protein
MTGDLASWLLTPLSGSAHHELPLWTAWHGRFMVAAWAIALPLGVLVARYFKVMPKQAWPDELDNKTWWHWHRILQTGGVLLMTVGCWLAMGHVHGAGVLSLFHRWLGWSLVASGWLQVIGGVWRGSKGGARPALCGDHYDMTVRRRLFEYVHKIVGTAAVLLAVVAIGIGLALADAPRWMAIALTLWWIALAWLARYWQERGRCIDTYQAIWGPDLAHPGNRIPAIGWGIRRYSREGWLRRTERKCKAGSIQRN